MNKKTRLIFEAVRNSFDELVVGLNADEYKEVLDEMASHIECCQNCWDEENKEQ